MSISQKVLSKEQAFQMTLNYQKKSNKPRIVLCHGVFDLVHPGHIEHFSQAKALGELLIVSITADEFIKKGPDRPYFNQERRAHFLASLEFIDFVYIVHSDSAEESIRLFQPDFYVKGPDYRDFNQDITGKIRVEEKLVESFGGKLMFTSGFTSSSTHLINNSLISQDTELRKWINEFKKKFVTDDVMNWIDRLKSVEVNILGESIIDVYTDCKPMAKSSKDPILAFEKHGTQKYLGGVLAIADSCSFWSESTEVFSACGQDFESLFREVGKNVSFRKSYIVMNDRPTIVKHRYVDKLSGVKVFEYYDYNPDEFELQRQTEIFNQFEKKLLGRPLFILADYGHGFFGDYLIGQMCKSSAFLAVNAQSNAGNRGFNTFSKYPRIDFLSLNGGELELELRKKNFKYDEVIPTIMEDKQCRYAVVTLGGDGLLVFDSNGGWVRVPALASKIVDKVGAGDSVLAMASMLAYLSAPIEIIGLLSSVVACFEVSQLGHKESLDIVDMKRFVKGLLG